MWRGWGRKPRLPGKFASGPGAVTHGAAAGGGGRTHGGALGGVGLSARRSASSRKVDCFIYLKIESVSARFDSPFRQRRFGLNETLFTAECAGSRCFYSSASCARLASLQLNLEMFYFYVLSFPSSF